MKILLLPKIKIHNANAVSSPFTIGFPALTAWLGGVHALQRKLNEQEKYKPLKFTSIGIAVHKFDLQTYKEGYNHVIIGTRNPLKKDGKPQAFIEEGRCHLTVSLIIEFENLNNALALDSLTKDTSKLLNAGIKFAGGDIIKFNDPQRFNTKNEGESFEEIRKKLMPGYVIIERKELMQKEMESGSDAVDAMLKYLKVKNKKRETGGWIVPIAVGFQGLTDLKIIANQRDNQTLHCFAESIVTLGEFVMPYNIANPDNMLWRYDYDKENQLYLCRQKESSGNS